MEMIDEVKRERFMNVPLDEETRAALEVRARVNGRAACREAARIIREEVQDFVKVRTASV